MRGTFVCSNLEVQTIVVGSALIRNPIPMIPFAYYGFDDKYLVVLPDGKL